MSVEQTGEAFQQGATQAAEGAQNLAQGAQNLAVDAAPVIQQGATEAAAAVQQGAVQAADAAQKGYDAAAPVVAEGAGKARDESERAAAEATAAAQSAATIAAPIIQDAASKIADGAEGAYKAAAPVVTNGASKAGAGARKVADAAAPVIANGARKVGAGARKVGAGARKVAGAAAKGATKGYRQAAPVVGKTVISLAGQAGDVLNSVKPPNLSFDTEAAQSALYGGVSMGVAAAASAATGCAAFAADILKLEIFRDFYQFLSIFFSSLKMPESFSLFFGNISAILSMGFTRLLSYLTDVKAALNPIMWFWIFLLVTIVCWIRLSCFMDTGKYAGIKMLSKKEKDKHNWKEINKKSMFQFKQVKYLLLALTTLYTPVTRNAIQMALCAPKYAYDKYECQTNITGEWKTDDKVGSFYAAPQTVNECYAGGSSRGSNFKLDLVIKKSFEKCFADNHVYMVGLSIIVLLAFSIYFPCLMGKVISHEKPTPLSPDDPENPVFHAPAQRPGPDGVFVETPGYLAKKKLYDELHGKPVIFNDEGKLVEYTDEIFLLEVQKQSHSPFTTMYKGFERTWANYKIYIMNLKLFQIFVMTLATCDILAKNTLTPQQSAIFASVAAVVSTGIFMFFSCKANPYVDPINDKMEMVSKVTLIVTPIMVLIAALVSSSILAQVVAILLNLSAAFGNAFMIWLTVSGMPCCQTKLKKYYGTLDFSSTTGLGLHEDPATLPNWNLDVERKRRIWKPFWDKVMNKNVKLSGCYDTDDEKDKEKIKANGGKKYLQPEVSGDGSTIPFPLRRFETQLSTLRMRGFDAFESGVLPMPPVEFKMRIKFQSMFEGPDVYCNDQWQTDAGVSAVKDGKLDSVNNFCRLEVGTFSCSNSGRYVL